MSNSTNAGRLKRHIARVRSGVRTRLFARGAFRTAALLIAGVIGALGVQALLGPNQIVGVGLLVLLAGLAVTAVVRHLIRPLVRFPSLRAFAADMDRRELGDNDIAINGLDLGERRDREPDELSKALIDHAIAKNLDPVLTVSSSSLDDGPRLRPGVAWLAVAAVGGAAFALLAPSALRVSALSLLHPVGFPYSPTVGIEVTPGEGEIESGADVQVYAQVTGAGDEARLVYRKEGGPWKSLAMQEVSRGEAPWEGRIGDSDVLVERSVPEVRFTAELSELRRDTEYRVRVGEHETDVFALDVLTPPRITAYEIVADIPDYTGLDDFAETAPIGNVTALTGSQVDVRLQIEGDAAAAEAVWDRGAVSPLARNDDGAFHFAFTVDGPHEYRVRLRDDDGRVRYESGVFSVDALEDRPPMVRVVEPGDDVDMPDGMMLPITLVAADDFGLSRVLMHVAKERDEPFATEIRTFDGAERESRVGFDWDISSLDLLPGEVATYYFEVFDNDAVSGAKSSRSSVFQVRFPSMAELYQQTEEEYSQDVVSAIEDLQKSEEAVAERLESLRQELERSREGVTWDKRKEVEAAMAQQEALNESLSDAMEALERSIDRLGDNNMSNYQILERMEAIRNLLDEIDDERMADMMEKVQEALQNMDERALQEAMKNLEMSQDEMLQSLDRSLENLKQILAEQKLEAIIEELQAVLDEQAEINDLLEEAEGDDADPEGDLADATDPNESAEGEGDDAEGESSDESDGAESEGAEGENEDGGEAEGENAEGENAEGENAEGENADGENADGENAEGENADGESAEGESAEGEQSEGEQSEGESSDSESSSEGEQSAGEQSEGDSSESESSDASGSESESQESQSGASDSKEQMSPEELAERQKELAERAEELRKKIEEMQELAEEVSPELDEALDKESPQDLTESAQQDMENASQAIQQQQEEAIRYGLSAEEQLQQAMTGLMQAQQSMQSAQQEQLSKDMLALGADLLHISEKQEAVLDLPTGESTRTLAAQQMRLYEATGRASEKLNDIGRETMMISQSMIRDLGAVLDDMTKATRSYESGNRTRGGKEAGTAMTGLNKAVMDLLRTNQQMNASSSSCSNPNPMSRIPSMMGMQQQLNQQTKSIQQGMSKGRIPRATGEEALRQLAARQEAIRRGIEEIAEDLKGRRDVLGRVGELGGEIEEVVKKMERGEVDRELIQRQEKILSRLLAADKSIRKQDEDNRRMGREGEDAERASPSAIAEKDLGKPDRLSKEIMQGRTDPFPPRYRGMIDAYFKALGQEAN